MPHTNCCAPGILSLCRIFNLKRKKRVLQGPAGPLASWRLALILTIVKFRCFSQFSPAILKGLLTLQNIFTCFSCPKKKSAAETLSLSKMKGQVEARTQIWFK